MSMPYHVRQTHEEWVTKMYWQLKGFNWEGLRWAMIYQKNSDGPLYLAFRGDMDSGGAFGELAWWEPGYEIPLTEAVTNGYFTSMEVALNYPVNIGVHPDVARAFIS